MAQRYEYQHPLSAYLLIGEQVYARRRQIKPAPSRLVARTNERRLDFSSWMMMMRMQDAAAAAGLTKVVRMFDEMGSNARFAHMCENPIGPPFLIAEIQRRRGWIDALYWISMQHQPRNM